MKISTYGLVTLDEMRAHKEAVEAEKQRLLDGTARTAPAAARKPRPGVTGSLSFDMQDEDEDATTGLACGGCSAADGHRHRRAQEQISY